jgi:hypothetical protein
MRTRLLIAWIIVGAGWNSAGLLRAETYPLGLKRMTEGRFSRRESRDQMFFGVSTQSFWCEDQGGRVDEFNKAVKKQPKKYACDRPLRGLAELAGKQFAFVLDSDDLKKKGYHRLHFDFDGDRDLTDDKPVDAEPDAEEQSGGIARVFFPLHVTLELKEGKFEYPFAITVSSHEEHGRYAYAALMPAAYREATIQLEGKPRHVAILDYNSNGRFNDEFKINPDINMSDGSIWPETGDIVIIDGKSGTGEYYWEAVSGPARQYLSKLVNIDGRFYDIKLTECGDKLTLKPSTLATGSITNPSERFRAFLHGKNGIVKISGEKGKPVAVPEGDWKLLSCCIEPGDPAATQPVAEAAIVKPPVMNAIATGQPEAKTTAPATSTVKNDSSERERKAKPPTRLVARGNKDYKAVRVRKDKSVELPFGAPYKPVVRPEGSRDDDTVRLELSIVGVGGEICSDIVLAGDRPHEPSFAIATTEGEIIERGSFEYG